MANKKPNVKPVEKEYSLKDIELKVVANINSRKNAEMLDFLSFICLERLAVDVTENTQFRVDNGKLYVFEPEVEAPNEEVEVA